MIALGSLLELGVDVEGHLGVCVPDLIRDPLHVEIVGQQGDRDVGPPQAVRRDVRQGRKPASLHLLAGECRPRFDRAKFGRCFAERRYRNDAASRSCT